MGYSAFNSPFCKGMARATQKIRCKVLLALVYLLCPNAHSQTLNLDSLKNVWKNESLADTIRLNSLQKIAWDGYLFTQPDSAFYYAQLQYDFAEKKELKKYMALALDTKAAVFKDQGSYGNSLKYHFQSLALKKEIDYKNGMISSLRSIGVIYYDQADFKQAIINYSQGLKIAEEIGDAEGTYKLLGSIGNVYSALNDNERALGYHTRSLKIIEESGDRRALAITLNNIGLIYYNQADYPNALDYHHKSLKIKEEIGYRNGVRISLSNIAEVYRFQGDYTKALEYQNRSLIIARELDRGVAMSLNRTGFIYEDLKDYPKAIHYCAQALEIGQEIGSMFLIEAAASSLSKSYSYTNDYKKAFEMHKLYISTRDSIDDIEGQREIIRQNFKYNYEKQALADSIAFVRQREIDGMEEANQRYLLVGSFTLVFVFVGIYLRIRFIKNQAERESLLQEIKLLKVKTNINLASLITTTEQPQLDKERIESTINLPLNQSDWDILNALYNNPAIGNKEIANVVFLSVEGVRSSLKKMYRFFDIEKSANQRVLLVIEAAKISNPALTQV